MNSAIEQGQFKINIDECQPMRDGMKLHELRVLLVPEDEGGFSAHALHLPGVVSQGETVEEAVANVREAFQGAMACYQESGMSVPWSQEVVMPDRPAGAFERWIVVGV